MGKKLCAASQSIWIELKNSTDSKGGTEYITESIPMEKYDLLSDAEFEKQFKNCTLNPSLFSHEAHLRLAWIHITNYGVDKACIAISDQILKFANTHGDPDKFNKTVTIAAIKVVYHFVQKSTAVSFQGFIKEFPRLKYNFKELLDSHYKIDIFNLQEARMNYIEPDILPFTDP